LGGGWGYLARWLGLTCDNLLSADLVTADGRFLTASAKENPDLFWALRGGGGNFGVVTSFEYRLHPVGQVLAGIVTYPFQIAKEVLNLFRDFTVASPDQMSSGIILGTWPDGTPVAGIIPCFTGALAQGEQLVKPLRTLGPPLMDQIGPMSYTAAQQLVDAFYPFGPQVYWKSSFLSKITDEVIDTMVAHCAQRPTPMCHGLIEHQLGGAVSRIDPDSTAFPHRDVEYTFSALGICTESSEVAHCTRWAREFWEAMQPHSTGGVYVNYMGREAGEPPDQIKATYGPEKCARLVKVKRAYDPTNLFRLNQNIKPN
jgi:FAD/FMN-containing dehydrogenase